MSDVNHHYTKTLYRHGAAAARRAHNPEDTRSKRVAGIIHHLHRCIKALAQPSNNPKDKQSGSETNKQSGDGLIVNMGRILC